MKNTELNNETQVLEESISNLLNEKKDLINVVYNIKDIVLCSKRRIITLVILLIILYLPIKNIAFSADTTANVIKLVELNNSIFLVYFGIAFTGYVFFQALSNKQTLKKLLTIKINKESYFEKYNRYFLNVFIYYAILIAVNYFLLIYLNYFEIELSYLNLETKNVLALIGLLFYSCFVIIGLIEIMSFVKNIYNYFNISVASLFIYEDE